jgi:dTDP-glucose pyrophosphorylase
MWPLTAYTPKGLLPLAGVPFVGINSATAAVGVEEVFLGIGRVMLDAWERFAATSPGGMTVRVAIEDHPLDTAGPVRAILDRLDERFLVLNGDVVIEADLHPLVASPETPPWGSESPTPRLRRRGRRRRRPGRAFIEKPPTAPPGAPSTPGCTR